MALPVFEIDGVLASDPTAGYADRVLALNPGGYWRLGDPVSSGTAVDSSGNGNTGTVVGGVTFGVAGLLSGDPNTAASFDGSSGYITVPDATTLNPVTAVSLFGWFNTSVLTQQYLFRKGAMGVSVEPSGIFTYANFDSGSNVFFLNNAFVADNTPYFFVLTDDGTTMCLYVNGVLLQQLARAASSPPSNLTGFAGISGMPLYIGALFTPSNYFEGVLDEMAVLVNVALTSAQVAQLYASRTIAVPNVWVNLGKAVSLDTARGKQQVLDTVQAGTMTADLLNLDRNLDPTNAASTFYPNLKPLRRVRATATIAATTYPLFTGYAERWPQNRVGPNFADTPLQAVDGFEPLSCSPVNAVFGQELSGARVGHTLDQASWPKSQRALDAGVFEIQAGTITTTGQSYTSVLTHIQDVEKSERGMFFIDVNGDAVFFDAHDLMLRTTSAATFSDNPGVGEYGYSDIVASYDRDRIYNDWTDARTGGGTVNAQDASSIASYWDRPQTFTSLLSSDADSLTAMQLELDRYKQPQLRFDTMTLRPGASTAFWQTILALDIGSRVTIKEQPPGGGAQIVWDGFIFNIAYKVPADVTDTTVTWALFPAATFTAFWIIDDPVYGVLDQGYMISPV